MERLGEGLKKLALAGIGTAAYAVEKSADILDTLAKKGEETVEQGKVLNKELKHNVKSTIKEMCIRDRRCAIPMVSALMTGMSLLIAAAARSLEARTVP